MATNFGPLEIFLLLMTVVFLMGGTPAYATAVGVLLFVLLAAPVGPS
jgi:hypothetical protein